VPPSLPDLTATLPSVVPYVEAGTSVESLHMYLQALLRSYSGGLLFVRSVQDGRFLLVNSSFEDLLGLPASEIVGRTSAELFDAEIATSHLAGDRIVAETGSPNTRFEASIDASGRRHNYVSHKFPLIDPDGCVHAVGGLAVDITELEDERRAHLQARFDAEARFRAVFTHAPVGQVFSGMDGVVTAANEPLARMLGYQPEEMVGSRALEFMPEYEHARAVEEADALRAGRIPSVSSIRHYKHRDGHAVPVRTTSALLPDADGAPRWWMTMVLDLTDEERTRAQLEQAHAAALKAADRLHLLHAIATAANEATTLDELAPHVLETVCARLGWPFGALLQLHSGGAIEGRHAFGGPARSWLPESPALPDADEPVFGRQDGHAFALVPLTGDRTGRPALLFCAQADEDMERQRDVLSLIGGECSRVIEREAADRRLRESETRFRSVFDSSPLAMGLTIGDTGTYSDVNAALCQLLGRTRADLIGKSARDIVHPDDAFLTDPAGAAAAAAPDGRHCFELRLLHSSGSVVIAQLTLAWMDGPDGDRLLLAQIEDITARRTAEDALRHQAEMDALTGLANRSYLGRVLAEMGEDGARCAILFIDLDGFKLINDTRGHDVGDEVLIEVATRLRAAVRPSDLVARFGGDEFVVVCRANGAAEDEAQTTARLVADRIETALAAPIHTQAGAAHITASIGISGGEIVPGAPQDLLQRADTAMYQAKRLGKDRRAIYDARLHERTVEYQRTEAVLRNALDEHRFIVHFQPILDLVDSVIIGFEALVRLLDEQGRTVPPDRFIGVAEQSGLIVPMGAWVLQESCRTVARLSERAGRPLSVSVNIAAQQAARSDLADTVTAALSEAGLPANALTLELTESALLDADDATLQQLVRLRKRGIQIGLDDFGTGYSSLSYLRRFPVSHIKVDRSFVSGMTSDAGDEVIVRAVTALASELGLFWVAEGVETEEQRDALRLLGPGFAQGYLFSRPVPADVLPGLLGLADPTG
jgi:diguanylate cyclase (GGDEF)-like protein/PAS domain S-box-containing protein